MAEELQQLLERINNDYLKKAEAEKEALLAAARAEAEKIVSDARIEAGKAEAKAKEAAKAFRTRAESAMRQASRDIVLELRNELKTRLDRALGQAAAAALTPEFMANLISDLARVFAKDANAEISIRCAVRDVAALEKALHSAVKETFKSNPVLFGDRTIRNGVQVSFKGDDTFFDFTDEAVCELLRDYVGGEVAKMLEQEHEEKKDAKKDTKKEVKAEA